MNNKQVDHEDDVRLGEIIEEGDSGQLVIVGFPYDAGVQRNGGRIGAREGPKAFRRYLINDPIGVGSRILIQIEIRTITIPILLGS